MKYSLRYSKTGMIHGNGYYEAWGIYKCKYTGLGFSDNVIRRLQVVVELVDCQDSTTALSWYKINHQPLGDKQSWHHVSCRNTGYRFTRKTYR